MIAVRGGLVVFAVEDRSAQLSWRRLPIGQVHIECGPNRIDLVSDGGPAVLALDGLTPDTDHDAIVRTTGGESRLTVRTLAPPPGGELYRFATMNDLHLSRRTFGVRAKMTEPAAIVDHPIRCAHSALDDLTAWGAQRLVVKGDLVDQSTDAAWGLADELLASATMPWDVTPGNHDIAHGEAAPFDAARRHGIDLVESVRVRDLPGLRLIVMNSAVEGVDTGRWTHLIDEAVDAAADTDLPVMLLSHHHPQPFPLPTHFPPGINSISARRLLQAVRTANPRVVGSSGHTHRHRKRNDVGVPWSEIGSTKDFPGVWAGYVVHEGGIRQVVRRVSSPDCLVWLDRTRAAAGGLWGLWSPGRLRDRCFSLEWPTG